MTAFVVCTITTLDELRLALAIRTRVFVEEQHVPPSDEIDAYDDMEALGTRAIHILGRLDGEPIATARLLLDVDSGDLPHIGRVAVLVQHRRTGYGTVVMRALEAEATQRGFRGVTLAAQLHAMPFYEHLGYAAHGPVFRDAGIEHREMDLLFEAER